MPFAEGAEALQLQLSMADNTDSGWLQRVPAERAASGLQLAAVYHGGPPALVCIPAVLAPLPTPPCCPVGGPRSDIVGGLRPVLLCVPFLDEVWPLLCDSAPPTTSLPVNCVRKHTVAQHVFVHPPLLLQRSSSSSLSLHRPTTPRGLCMQ